jgi:hypothetical protein
MVAGKFSRRRFLKSTPAASTVGIRAPHICTAHAAGMLSVGFCDHRVPTANDVIARLRNAWAATERIEKKVDDIPRQGSTNLLAIAAKAQAKSDHDMPALLALILVMALLLPWATMRTFCLFIVI